MTSHDDDRARLRFHLELQDGFWFALVAADDRAARDRLREEARGWAEAGGVAFLDHALDDAGSVPDLVGRLGRARDGLQWVIADARGDPAPVAEEAVGRLLMALNERREALRRGLRGGLVVEGPSRAKVLLRNLAPDLFSIRSCIVEPAGPSAEVHGDAPWWLGEGLVDRSQVRDWGQPGLPWSRWAIAPEVAEDEARTALDAVARLEGLEGDGARRSELNALSRAVEALLAQGWVTEAAPVVERMTALATALVEGARRQPTGGVPAITAPDVWARSMRAEATEATASIAHAQGDLTGARELWRQALAQRQALAGEPLDASTAARHADVAHALARLGELALQAGDEGEASKALEAARAIHESLVAAFPRHAEWRSELALSWSYVGDARLERGDPDGARQAFDVAIDLRRALIAEHPDDPRLRAVLGVVLGRRALACTVAGQPDQALADAREARDHLAFAASTDPGNVGWQGWLATAWSRLGDAARAAGHTDEAGRCWEEALNVRRALCEGDPDNARWHRALAVVLDRLAELSVTRGELERAAALSAEALDIAEQLGGQEPTNADFQLGLARARLTASEIASAGSEPSEAARLVRLALAAHAHLEALGATGWRVRRLGDRLAEVRARLDPPSPDVGGA